MLDHPTTPMSGDAGAMLDPEVSTHEVWRALCQLDARERGGDGVAVVDAGRLRRYLEDRIRAELPELSGYLPPPKPEPPRPAWPLLVALAVVQQGSGGFRTGLRIKPPRAGVAAPVEVEEAAFRPPAALPSLPPITVTPLVPQPAAHRAAALVRAEFERLPPVAVPAVSLRRRLAAAISEPPLPLPARVPPPPIAAQEVAPPLVPPPLPAMPPSMDDTAERLARLERDSASIEARAIMEEATRRLRPIDRAATITPEPFRLPMAAMPPGIVVEVTGPDDDGPLGIEAGLLHAEEAEVTILSAGSSDPSVQPAAEDTDAPGVHRLDDPLRLEDEAEVEILLPGMSPKPRPVDGTASSRVDRFLGALVGRR